MPFVTGSCALEKVHASSHPAADPAWSFLGPFALWSSSAARVLPTMQGISGNEYVLKDDSSSDANRHTTNKTRATSGDTQRHQPLLSETEGSSSRCGCLPVVRVMRHVGGSVDPLRHDVTFSCVLVMAMERLRHATQRNRAGWRGEACGTAKQLQQRTPARSQSGDITTLCMVNTSKFHQE